MTFSVFPMPLAATNLTFSIALQTRQETQPVSGWSTPGMALVPPKCLLPEYIGDQENSLAEIFNQNDWVQSEVWPLVFYGPPGVGKTTLGCWVARYLSERCLAAQTDRNDRKLIGPEQRKAANRNPNQPIVIQLSAGDFKKSLMLAIDTDSVQQYWENFLAAAVVFIDNLHQLAGNPVAQEHFVRLVDALLAKNIPLLVTLDRHPLQHTSLSASLTSRLSQGLVLALRTPGRFARERIIHELSSKLKITLTSSLKKLLLDNEHLSVPLLYQRLLQHKLKQKTAKSPTSENERSRPEPEKLTSKYHDLRNRTTQLSKNYSVVCQLVADEYELTSKELCSNSRKQTTVLARGVAIYLFRSLFQLSFTAIGHIFSGRDHSTTIHSHQKIVNRMQSDHQLKQQILSLSTRIQSLLPPLGVEEEASC